MDLNNDSRVFDLVKECRELVAQIVVQTRCHKGTGSRECLNLTTSFLDLRTERWRSSPFLPLHIRIFCTETVPSTKQTRSKVLLEAWKIALEDYTTNNRHVNAADLRKSMVIVVRGIFSFLRLMPALELQRQLAKLPNSGYTLEYALGDSVEQETWDNGTSTKSLGAIPLLLRNQSQKLHIQATYRNNVSDLLPHIGEHVQDSYVVTAPITIRPNSFEADRPGPGSYGNRQAGSQPRSIERHAPIYENRPINPHSDGPVLVSTHANSRPREIPQPEDELDIGTPSSSSFQERTGSFKADRSGLKFSISPFRDASPIHFMPGSLTSSDMPVLESSPSSRSGAIRGGRRRSSASEHAPVNFASDTTDDVFQFEGAPLPTPVDQFPFSSGQRPPYTTGRTDVFSSFERPPVRNASLDRLSNSDTVKLEEFMQLMNSMPRTIEHAETTLEPFSGRFDRWS